MRNSLFVMILISFSIANAHLHKLPDVQISSKAIGGTVLLIQMKDSLVIEHDVHEEISKELGLDGRKKLYRDMILAKDVSYLRKTYCLDNRKATQNLVMKYESIISQQQKLTMN